MAIDFDNWLQRRNRREPTNQGSWNVLPPSLPCMEIWHPAGYLALRGNDSAAWSDWPSSSALRRYATVAFDMIHGRPRCQGAEFQRLAFEGCALHFGRALESPPRIARACQVCRATCGAFRPCVAPRN